MRFMMDQHIWKTPILTTPDPSYQLVEVYSLFQTPSSKALPIINKTALFICNICIIAPVLQRKFSNVSLVNFIL